MKTLMSELLDEIAHLKAVNRNLHADLKLSRGKHAWATRRARQAEMERDTALGENVALRASEMRNSPIPDAQPECDAPDPDGPFPTIDPELVDLRRLILALRTEDHETFAPAICWALNGVKTITTGLAEATGKVRRPGRRAA